MVIRKAGAADLDAVERIYDEIHEAEAAGRTTTRRLARCMASMATKKSASCRPCSMASRA